MGPSVEVPHVSLGQSGLPNATRAPPQTWLMVEPGVGDSTWFLQATSRCEWEEGRGGWGCSGLSRVRGAP